MATKKLYPYNPDYAVHPGECLEEVLESREIKQIELANRLGISEKHLSQIINKKVPISPELALQLEKVLNISANIWNNMNANYYLFEARKKEANLLFQKIDWIKNFPIKDLKNRGFLPKIQDPEIILEKLLKFFNISSPEHWAEYYNQKSVSFRKSAAFADNLPHIASWLQAGEIKATEQETAVFNKDIFRNNLEKIRQLTCLKPSDFELKLKQYCSDSGVVLVFVPEFKNTHISGATRWLTPEKALIIMSLRHKTNDHFWFTFFHEAGHIFLHNKKNVFIDSRESYKSKEEDEANKFALNLLMSEKEYKEFVKMNNFSLQAVELFSKKIGIHPAIIVGRLQHEKIIPFNSTLSKLKEHFELTEHKKSYC